MWSFLGHNVVSFACFVLLWINYCLTSICWTESCVYHTSTKKKASHCLQKLWSSNQSSTEPLFEKWTLCMCRSFVSPTNSRWRQYLYCDTISNAVFYTRAMSDMICFCSWINILFGRFVVFFAKNNYYLRVLIDSTLAVNLLAVSYCST